MTPLSEGLAQAIRARMDGLGKLPQPDGEHDLTAVEARALTESIRSQMGELAELADELEARG